MSEATQLLNNLDEINSRLADPSGEGHIIIGDDRFITVPDELKRIAVQYDHNIETVTFDCPRFWDDHDMSKMNVYINYLRSDKAPGVYKADNVRVDETDESIMHFDWTISKNVTSTAGNIVFLVCVKKADDEGNEGNHWNSELCKDCYVSEGLEINGSVSETIRPDVIEQWYRELMALANSGEFDGEPGVGIASIEQTSVSTEDGGENIVTMTLTDGQTADVVIHNGSKGVTALPIVTCYTSDGVLYSNNTGLYNYNKTFFVEGRQFVFIPAANTGATAEANTTDTPMVSLGIKDTYFIKLRSANDQSTIVPIGMLKHGVPYTMTFSGEYWLIDSYVENSQEIPAQIPLITATSSDGETYTYTGEYNEDFTDVAKQIIFVHVGGGNLTENSSENVKLQFELDDGEVLQHDVKLRSATLGTTTVPVGALKYHTPYTMTFTGNYWLIDSCMGISQVNAGVADHECEAVTTDEMEHAQLGPELITSDGMRAPGWTGSLADGFTNGSANTSALYYVMPESTAGKLYQISFSSSVPMTTTNLFVRVGNSPLFNLYGQPDPISIGIRAPEDGNLEFIPESGFTGTLTNISIKQIISGFDGSYPITDSDGALSFNIRTTKASGLDSQNGENNLFMGKASGQWNTSGYGNVAVGSEAMENNTSGFWNVGMGYKALENNTAGSRNIGIGYVSLYKNEVGQRNIAIGTHSLREHTTGDFNIAIGADAQLEGTEGEGNIGIGTGTLYKNSGGNYNTAIGYSAMAGGTVGSRGDDNIAIGRFAAPELGEGSNNNIILGQQAGYNMVNAKHNVVVGAYSGYGGNVGNVVIGNLNGRNLNEWASSNIILGYCNGDNINSGSYNIIIGREIPGEGGSWMYNLNIGNLLRGILVGGTDPHLEVNGGLSLPEIPTSDPGITGRVWNDNGTLKISTGA